MDKEAQQQVIETVEQLFPVCLRFGPKASFDLSVRIMKRIKKQFLFRNKNQLFLYQSSGQNLNWELSGKFGPKKLSG